MTKRKAPPIAVFTLDNEGYWNAAIHLSAKEGVFTFGRTLRHTQQRLQEALALHLDVAESEAQYVTTLAGIPGMEDLAARVQQAKGQQEEAAAEWARVSREAAKVLTGAGVSIRDAAAVLGVTGGRVQQLLKESV